MTLADDEGDAQSNPPFSHARVLGIYHVNVIYTGPGMIDYSSKQLNFLWVQWFHQVQQIKWENCKLDLVAFLPMADDNAFGFLDPKNVLWVSHILPTFSRGHIHADTISMSLCTCDSHNWKQYYMNGYVLNLFAPPAKLMSEMSDVLILTWYHWGQWSAVAPSIYATLIHLTSLMVSMARGILIPKIQSFLWRIVTMSIWMFWTSLKLTVIAMKNYICPTMKDHIFPMMKGECQSPLVPLSTLMLQT